MMIMFLTSEGRRLWLIGLFAVLLIAGLGAWYAFG